MKLLQCGGIKNIQGKRSVQCGSKLLPQPQAAQISHREFPKPIFYSGGHQGFYPVLRPKKRSGLFQQNAGKATFAQAVKLFGRCVQRQRDAFTPQRLPAHLPRAAEISPHRKLFRVPRPVPGKRLTGSVQKGNGPPFGTSGKQRLQGLPAQQVQLGNPCPHAALRHSDLFCKAGCAPCFFQLSLTPLRRQKGKLFLRGGKHCGAFRPFLVPGSQGNLSLPLLQNQTDRNALPLSPIQAPQRRKHLRRGVCDVFPGTHTEHFPAPPSGKISFCKAGTRKDRLQVSGQLLRNRFSVRCLPAGGNRSGHIFRALHSALDLCGADPRLFQLGKPLQKGKIL